ncbi:MAG: methyltransferase domain-containing protein [Chloroflexi bacterium]|nr:methyltransferase domain-containing protein [Chloroflexota bacterium]
MSNEHVISTGHDLADSMWQDQHFNFAREPYEAMVRWVGIQPSGHVLDAGCGIGSYLPWFAELVGPTGRLSALDIAPENIVMVESRFNAKPLACPVEARAGSVLELPYPDATFDAVWSASVFQYQTEAQADQMLAEFKRVTTSGGLIAIKDFNWSGSYNSVVPFLIVNRHHEALCRSGNVEWNGIMRSPELPRILRSAGLTEVRQRFFAVEKRAPLNANDRAFCLSFFMWQATQSKSLPLTPDDQAYWRELSEGGRAAEKTDSPDFYQRNEYTLAVGRVP